jgi:predicted PurR-regulated permease PerM
MLINIETLHSWSQKYLPFTSENTHVLYNELNNMTLSNAVAVPLIGIIQGSAAGLGYWFFGLSEPFFWAVITAFVSLLPLIGTTLIWAPASLFLLATSSLFNGLGLMIYGVLVIINIDNISRFVIQKRFADVHPLVTVFGVILGLNLFGLPGLIFGPLMISYFILFIKIYRNIYHKESI